MLLTTIVELALITCNKNNQLLAVEIEVEHKTVEHKKIMFNYNYVLNNVCILMNDKYHVKYHSNPFDGLNVKIVT